jgi:co-chaperonin GroES (HSP10)|tara:strand:- start:95 stop:520 length:426 start_codon:yes stop_codon:yes gene_type:complete
MSKTLFVPERYAKVAAQPRKKETSPENITAKEKLPQPSGWRILILPYRGKGKTEGGVYLPDQHVDREALATVCGYVVKIGPLAYKDQDKFGDTGPWCKEGDWVIFGRYAGSRFKIDGGEVRLLNDDEVLATISNPEDIIHT